MGIYKKILAAYDGSESGKNALRQAIALARECGDCTVHAATVMLSAEDMGMDLMGQGVLREPSERILDEARAIASEEGTAITTSIEQGAVYERIAGLAESGGFDLVVMGRRGLTRLERMLMGSVTSRVVSICRKDVLVVPMTARLGVKKLLAATDLSEFSGAALDRAFAFAKAFGSDLSVVSAIESNEEYLASAAMDALEKRAANALSEIKKRGQAEGLKVATSVREGNPYMEIVSASREAGAEMLFMGSHGRTGIKRLLMGSITEKVIGHTNIAALVARA